MNSNFYQQDPVNTSPEVETNNETSNNNNHLLYDEEEAHLDEMRQELLIKRDTRNTSEKFRDHDLPDVNSMGFDIKSNDNISTRESSPQNRPQSMESLDEAPLQLPSPADTSNERNTLQVMSGSIMNLLQNVIAPTRQPTLPRLAEPIQQERPRSHSLFSLFTNLPMFHHNHRNDLTSITNHEQGEEENHTNTQHEQANQNQEPNSDALTNGALIVRTVTPGPNGLMIVRMRVIPLDEVFGGDGDNLLEGPDFMQARLFGALVRLLASTNHFSMERGLEKESLDSLPVVKFNSEAFKNVDEENKKCSICFDDYEDDQEIRYLWCLHRFHKGCVDHWLGEHSTCPICKKDFAEAAKESFE